MNAKLLIKTIKKHNSFLLSTHVNPDPDALCSELSLALYLKSLGKKVVIVNESPILDRFKFLPQSRMICDLKSVNKLDFEVAIIVDCGDLDRVGKVQSLITKEKTIINIDHHITNKKFGKVNYVLSDASSTAEIIYDLLKLAGCRFTKDIAICLYTGIMTDTGSFRYENTTARTHFIAGDLLRFEFSIYDLYRDLYETIPMTDMRAFFNVINGFQSYENNKIVVVKLKKSVLKKISEDFDLRDTIFKFLRSVKGVEVVVIFTEFERNRTRVNFRSSGRVDVAKIASLFNGGGHRKASGGMVDAPFSTAHVKVLDQIRRVL